MLKNLYDYPELERVELESGRHYLDSNGKPVPSVTTVLSNTSNASEGIHRWRQRVGDLEVRDLQLFASIYEYPLKHLMYCLKPL